MKLLFALALGCVACAAQGLLGQVDFAPGVETVAQRVEAPGLFRGLGLLSEKHFKARVRGSQDGVTWGEWREVEVGHEGGTLVWFDDAIRMVEAIGAGPMRLFFIEPGRIEPGRIEPGSAKTGLETRRGAAGDPPIVTRAGWGCGAECAPKEAPIYANVTHLIVHHSAGANASSDWASVIRSIWVLHVKGNGWNDIGYNFLVDPNGIIYEGRAGGDGVIGAHFSGVNTGTMGVCMVGTFTSQAPGRAAVESLKKVLGWQAESGSWTQPGRRGTRPAG